jgi:hypothetical protein
MQQQMAMIPEDMIGAIKIKDGLFIGDEFAAQVSHPAIFQSSRKLDVCSIFKFAFLINYCAGFRICSRQQGFAHCELRRQADEQSLGEHGRGLLDFLLDGLRVSGAL